MSLDLQTWRFVLRDGETTRLRGLALICPDVRYVSIAWLGADRLDRRFVTPAIWRDLEHELLIGVGPSPLPSSSAITRTLTSADDRTVSVMYLSIESVATETPADVAPALDAQLRQALTNQGGR